jgi:hypothetical protein
MRELWRWIWLKLAGDMTRRSSEQHQPEKELWRRRIGLCLAMRQYLIRSSRLQGLVNSHVYCWTLEVIHMTCLQLKRKCFLLKLSFVCHFTFLWFFISMNLYFLLGQNRLEAPPFSHCVYGKICLHLTFPVSQLPVTWLEGWLYLCLLEHNRINAVYLRRFVKLIQPSIATVPDDEEDGNFRSVG